MISSENGRDENEGYVSFRAFLRDGGYEYCLAERSRFLFEQGQWFYVDGEIDDSTPPKPLTIESLKVGRNDPCPCGSGKKHKKVLRLISHYLKPNLLVEKVALCDLFYDW